jgi:hypothetical protein
MFDALVARWKHWRSSEKESELDRAEKESGEVESPGPGGWSPIGDLSKLSEDE